MAKGQPHVRPGGTQRKQESAIHHAFEMRCKSHSHVGEMLLGKSCQET